MLAPHAVSAEIQDAAQRSRTGENVSSERLRFVRAGKHYGQPTSRRATMAGEKTEMKGKANKVVGGAKKSVGRVTKNRSLEAKGAAQKVKGYGQETVGKATRRVTKSKSK
jgi:uncharacterized protein YjbJ (UPF0337 family)